MDKHLSKPAVKSGGKKKSLRTAGGILLLFLGLFIIVISVYLAMQGEVITWIFSVILMLLALRLIITVVLALFHITWRIKKSFEKPLRLFYRLLNVVLTIFWFCVAFSPAVYFLLSFGYNIYLFSACTHWPATQGEISYVYSYENKIDYTYTVKDLPHTSSRISFASNAEVKNYTAGAKVLVYYDPANPSQSVLKPGGALDATYFVYLGLGVLFVFLGKIAFGWGIGRYKTITDPVYWI